MTERSSAHIGTSIFTSVLTSALVTLGVLYFSGNLKIPNTASTTTEETAIKTDDTPIAAPALTGLTTAIAGDVLKARNLRMVVQEERPDNGVPAGHICAQDPLPDSMLTAESAVNVVVSTGPDLIPMIDVSGKPLDEAKTLLTDAGFVVGEIIESTEGEPGKVTETVPAKDEMVTAGSTVNITYTNASAIPKLVGMSIGKAKKTLTEAGFKVGKIRRGFSDYLDYNAVITQDPAAETVAAPETEVNLVINSD